MSSPTDSDVRRGLRDLLRQADISQVELAHRVGMSPMQLNRLLRNRKLGPTVSEVHAIEAAIGLQLGDTPGVASDTWIVAPGITSLDEALSRFRAAAELSPDLEPVLACRRQPDGRRRWELTVRRRSHEREDQSGAAEG